MLPNHPPLVVAEQFAMLEALHPGRIDLGIGRAPGTDHATAAALRRSPSALGAEDFPLHLLDLMGLLGDVRTDAGLWSQFAATPVSTSTPWIGLLGSSDYSAELAGYLGLPYSYAHHFDMGHARHDRAGVRALPERVSPLPGARRAVRDRLGQRAHRSDDATRRTGSRRRARIVLLARRTGRFEPMQATRRRGRASVDGRSAGLAVEPHRRHARRRGRAPRGARLADARRRGDGEHGHVRHRGTRHAASSCSRTRGSREWQSAPHGSREGRHLEWRAPSGRSGRSRRRGRRARVARLRRAVDPGRRRRRCPGRLAAAHGRDDTRRGGDRHPQHLDARAGRRRRRPRCTHRAAPRDASFSASA